MASCTPIFLQAFLCAESPCKVHQAVVAFMKRTHPGPLQASQQCIHDLCARSLAKIVLEGLTAFLVVFNPVVQVSDCALSHCQRHSCNPCLCALHLSCLAGTMWDIALSLTCLHLPRPATADLGSWNPSRALSLFAGLGH